MFTIIINEQLHMQGSVPEWKQTLHPGNNHSICLRATNTGIVLLLLILEMGEIWEALRRLPHTERITTALASSPGLAHMRKRSKLIYFFLACEIGLGMRLLQPN